MRLIPCNICGERRDFTEVYHSRPESLRVVRCNGCGLVFVNPAFTPQEHLEYYNTTYWEEISTDGQGSYDSMPPEFLDRWQGRAKADVDYLCTHCHKVKPGVPFNVLEVGCGYGAHLEEIHRRHPEAKLAAVEPNKRFYNCIANRLPDVQILGKTLETLSGARMLFDCVIVADTLEHALDPTYTMKRISTILAPDGICLISTPNCDSTAGHVYRLAHLFYFSEATLRTLLTHSFVNIVRVDVRGEFGTTGRPYLYVIAMKK